jgi:nitrogen fixation protein NifX
MSQADLSKDIALRIALAARALPDTDPSRLLKVLEAITGLPPSKGKLATLNLKMIRSAADGELSDIDTDSLKVALSILKGEQDPVQEDDLPALDEYTEGDMPGSIRVAVASNKGEELDGHFGSCRRFLVYQMDVNEIRLIEVRNIGSAPEDVDKNAWRAGIIEDCNVLFIASVGGPAAAKVVKAGIYPIKHPDGGKIRDKLIELQKVLAGTPPPWLAKVMGHEVEERVRFERSAQEG